MIKKRKARILIYLLVSACIVVPLYILCHEVAICRCCIFLRGGHDSLSVITGAYMNSSGGSYNRFDFGYA